MSKLKEYVSPLRMLSFRTKKAHSRDILKYRIPLQFDLWHKMVYRLNVCDVRQSIEQVRSRLTIDEDERVVSKTVRISYVFLRFLNHSYVYKYKHKFSRCKKQYCIR
jgi:hypothetical protein